MIETFLIAVASAILGALFFNFWLLWIAGEFKTQSETGQ